MAKKEKPPSKGAISDPKGTIYNDVNKILTLFKDTESNSKEDWIKVVYKYFQNNIRFFEGDNREIIKQGTYSYGFLRCICQVFDIYSLEFYDAFYQVTNLKGKELNDIKTLYSSSLLGLLCFYNIRNDHLTIKINGIDYLFTKVFFEIKNKCIVDIAPSNIDILLLGKNINSDKPTLFFLESKFSEYLKTGTREVSIVYHNIYKNNYKGVFEKTGINYSDPSPQKTRNDNKHKLVVTIGDNTHYCEGLKQMISHHIGIKNLLNDNIHKETIRRIPEIINDIKSYEVLLGTIVYKFENDLAAFDDYKNIYEKMAESMPDQDRIKMVDSLLTYQEVFKNYPLQQSIKSYYNLQQD